MVGIISTDFSSFILELESMAGKTKNILIKADLLERPKSSFLFGITQVTRANL